MPWVSYKQLREELDIVQVIEDYDFELRGTGAQRKCMCPTPSCRNPAERSLSVNAEQGVFKCWKCDAKGNAIDFAAFAEGLDPLDPKEFRQAAVILQEKYGLASERPTRSRTDEKGKVHRRAPKPATPDGKRRKSLVNEPLDFELKGLDPEHPSVQALGLKAATIERFGLGYCERRGMLQGRIAIPLRDRDGRLIGYAGRAVDPEKVNADNPLYVYPKPERTRSSDQTVLRFDRSAVVYNAESQTEPVEQLIVVEDPYLVWLLYDQGVHRVVAILADCSEQQVSGIVDLAEAGGRVLFATNSPQAIATMTQVARARLVRWLFADSDRAVAEQAQEIG